MKHSHLTVQVNECKINTTFSPFFEKKIFKVGFFNEKFITNFFLKKVSFVQVVRYQPHPDLICGLRQKCRKTKIIQPRNISYTYSLKYMYYKVK